MTYFVNSNATFFNHFAGCDVPRRVWMCEIKQFTPSFGSMFVKLPFLCSISWSLCFITLYDVHISLDIWQCHFHRGQTFHCFQPNKCQSQAMILFLFFQPPQVIHQISISLWFNLGTHCAQITKQPAREMSLCRTSPQPERNHFPQFDYRETPLFQNIPPRKKTVSFMWGFCDGKSCEVKISIYYLLKHIFFCGRHWQDELMKDKGLLFMQ